VGFRRLIIQPSEFQTLYELFNRNTWLRRYPLAREATKLVFRVFHAPFISFLRVTQAIQLMVQVMRGWCMWK